MSHQNGASSTRKLDKRILTQMISQQSVDRISSFQHAGHPSDIANDSKERVAAPGSLYHKEEALKFDNAVLAGFRIGYRDDAASTAEKTRTAGALATQTILQMAGWLQEMKSRLSRKEFGTFIKGLLQWVGDEAKKYLDIARAFQGFDLFRLQRLEPFTLLKLRSKRYAPVVARLRSQPVITPKLVQDLIDELLPKLTRKKPGEPISGWKQCRSGGGRYYRVELHDEETGLSIEQQALSENLLPQKVIAEAVALRAQHKSGSVQLSEYQVAQLEELHTVVDNARTLERENRKLGMELNRSYRRIAELEAKLAESVELDGVETDEVATASCELNEYLEAQASAIASFEMVEHERETTEAFDYLEPVFEDDCFVEKEEDAQNLRAEDSSVLKQGDLVQISVARPNGDKTWNGSRGYIQKFLTVTGKVVVLLQGDYRSQQFFKDELHLVESVESHKENEMNEWDEFTTDQEADWSPEIEAACLAEEKKYEDNWVADVYCGYDYQESDI